MVDNRLEDYSGSSHQWGLPTSHNAFAQAFIYIFKNKEILMEGCKYFCCISSTREKQTGTETA
jgi:hypothetical protein